MVKCMRVLPCYMGGVWVGRSPPQGHSPNDMVNCVCNLPYGGSLGVLWGSGGVREVLGWIGGVQGGIEGVPGRFLRSPGGPLEKVIFSFLGGEFVNGLMKY